MTVTIMQIMEQEQNMAYCTLQIPLSRRCCSRIAVNIVIYQLDGQTSLAPGMSGWNIRILLGQRPVRVLRR